jgi:hypothetical protein
MVALDHGPEPDPIGIWRTSRMLTSQQAHPGYHRRFTDRDVRPPCRTTVQRRRCDEHITRRDPRRPRPGPPRRQQSTRRRRHVSRSICWSRRLPLFRGVDHRAPDLSRIVHLRQPGKIDTEKYLPSSEAKFRIFNDCGPCGGLLQTFGPRGVAGQDGAAATPGAGTRPHGAHERAFHRP